MLVKWNGFLLDDSYGCCSSNCSGECVWRDEMYVILGGKAYCRNCYESERQWGWKSWPSYQFLLGFFKGIRACQSGMKEGRKEIVW